MTKTMRVKNGSNFQQKVIMTFFLILFLMWVLIPFFVVLITSLVPQAELISKMSFIWFPEKMTLEAYRTVFFDDINAINGVSSILVGFGNTLWQTIPTTLIGLFVSGLSAFAFAKIKFPGRNFLFGCLIATMMFPSTVLTMPSYIFYDMIGWTDSTLPIIIPGMFGSAITVFYIRQFMYNIPDSLIEAAKIDGMGAMGIYIKIIFPLVVPAFLIQGILMFIGGYNNFQGPLLYLSTLPELFPLQLTLNQFQYLYGGYNAVISASVLLAMLPLLILFAFSQKFILESVVMTGMKE